MMNLVKHNRLQLKPNILDKNILKTACTAASSFENGCCIYSVRRWAFITLVPKTNAVTIQIRPLLFAHKRYLHPYFKVDCGLT